MLCLIVKLHKHSTICFSILSQIFLHFCFIVYLFIVLSVCLSCVVISWPQEWINTNTTTSTTTTTTTGNVKFWTCTGTNWGKVKGQLTEPSLLKQYAVCVLTTRLRTIPSVLLTPDTTILKASDTDTRYRCRYRQWSDSGDRQLTTAQLLGVWDISSPGPFPLVTTVEMWKKTC